MIVAGRLTDPRLARADRGAGRGAPGFPILAEPTSQLRFGPTTAPAVVAAYDLIARDAARAPRARPRPPLRRHADEQAAARLARATRRSIRSSSTPRAAGTSRLGGPEPSSAPTPPRWPPVCRADRSRRASAAPDGAAPGSRPRRRRRPRSTRSCPDRRRPLSEPALQRLLGAAYADGDRVMLASSMPIRDAEAFLGGGRRRRSTFHANRGRQRHRRARLDRRRASPSARATPTWLVLGDLALAHDLGGLAVAAAVTGAAADRRRRQRRRRHLRLPAAGRSRSSRPRFERLFTTPSRLDVERAAALFGLPYERIDSEPDLVGPRRRPERVLAHVPLERAGNVELHARIAAAVATALEPESSSSARLRISWTCGSPCRCGCRRRRWRGPLSV